MLLYSHYPDFSKHYRRWLKCKWHPLQRGLVKILKIDDGY